MLLIALLLSTEYKRNSVKKKPKSSLVVLEKNTASDSFLCMWQRSGGAKQSTRRRLVSQKTRKNNKSSDPPMNKINLVDILVFWGPIKQGIIKGISVLTKRVLRHIYANDFRSRPWKIALLIRPPGVASCPHFKEIIF